MRGALRLFTMRIGTRPVAALYGFVYNGVLYCYLSGFDPEFEAVSPGVLLLHQVVESAIHEGLVACDLLRGREAYKYRWNICEQPLYARRLWKI